MSSDLHANEFDAWYLWGPRKEFAVPLDWLLVLQVLVFSWGVVTLFWMTLLVCAPRRRLSELRFRYKAWRARKHDIETPLLEGIGPLLKHEYTSLVGGTGVLAVWKDCDGNVAGHSECLPAMPSTAEEKASYVPEAVYSTDDIEKRSARDKCVVLLYSASGKPVAVAFRYDNALITAAHSFTKGKVVAWGVPGQMGKVDIPRDDIDRYTDIDVARWKVKPSDFARMGVAKAPPFRSPRKNSLVKLSSYFYQENTDPQGWVHSVGYLGDARPGSSSLITATVNAPPGASGSPVYCKGKLAGVYVGNIPHRRTNVIRLFSSVIPRIAPVTRTAIRSFGNRNWKQVDRPNRLETLQPVYVAESLDEMGGPNAGYIDDVYSIWSKRNRLIRDEYNEEQLNVNFNSEEDAARGAIVAKALYESGWIEVLDEDEFQDAVEGRDFSHGSAEFNAFYQDLRNKTYYRGEALEPEESTSDDSDFRTDLPVAPKAAKAAMRVTPEVSPDPSSGKEPAESKNGPAPIGPVASAFLMSTSSQRTTDNILHELSVLRRRCAVLEKRNVNSTDPTNRQQQSRKKSKTSSKKSSQKTVSQ